MSSTNPVFEKLFVREFYRLNAGFFILIITLTFGFMSGTEHKALAQFFVASPPLTLIPVTVWILYTIKVVNFNLYRISLPQNEFILSFTLLPVVHQHIQIARSLVIQFTPVLLYAAFLIAIAVQTGNVFPILIICLSIASLLAVSVLIFRSGFQTPVKEKISSSFESFLDKHITRPLQWMYVTSIIRQEPLLYLGTKLFSCILIFAVQQLYMQEAYDARLIAMVGVVAGSGNFLVISLVHQFDLKTLAIMRNLPVAVGKRFINFLIVTSMLMLPEIIVFLTHAPDLSFYSTVTAALIIPSICILLLSLMFVNFRNQETFARLVFGMTMAHIALILFKVPVIVFIFADVTLAYFLFSKRYYTFEFADHKD